MILLASWQQSLVVWIVLVLINIILMFYSTAVTTKWGGFWFLVIWAVFVLIKILAFNPPLWHHRAGGTHHLLIFSCKLERNLAVGGLLGISRERSDIPTAAIILACLLHIYISEYTGGRVWRTLVSLCWCFSAFEVVLGFGQRRSWNAVLLWGFSLENLIHCRTNKFPERLGNLRGLGIIWRNIRWFWLDTVEVDFLYNCWQQVLAISTSYRTD